MSLYKSPFLEPYTGRLSRLLLIILKKETLEKMVEINPALQDLIDELGLEDV